MFLDYNDCPKTCASAYHERQFGEPEACLEFEKVASGCVCEGNKVLYVSKLHFINSMQIPLSLHFNHFTKLLSHFHVV